DGGVSDWTSEVSASTPEVPPAAPTNLVANVASPTEIDLTWTDNSSNDSAFTLWRKSGGADYQKIATLVPGTTAFSDTGLNAGTTYTYRLRAVNIAGASDWTSEVSASTPALLPAAPTALTANASSPTQIDLTWSDNSDNEFAFALVR